MTYPCRRVVEAGEQVDQVYADQVRILDTRAFRRAPLAPPCLADGIVTWLAAIRLPRFSSSAE